MMIASFGRITPLQGDMLLLVGFGPSSRDGIRDLETPVEQSEILENIRKGREELVRSTGQDFSHSLQSWHNFLMSSEEFKRKYTHPYGWRNVERAVKAELRKPERARLEALADQM
ncbi:hypothetical protein [Rhodovulum sulfidophilum]|uniref:hypothetical protein n=1 Tax=Rhodovulum sulfidophilum TaxID=35806 RepID=UPI00117B009C|nr:hypothetical protein [Rhodovulum sulfidophilum]MBL3554163.1 hypothetical protein [Rhodovulum sulfidophilum]